MFTRAVEGREHSVIYISADGKRLIRRKGTWSWRNNNPGNIMGGPKARKLKSIGVAGRLAVFSDFEAGRKALKGVLQTSYPKTTLFNLVKHYAPPDENDVRSYRRLLKKFTGFDLKRRVGQLKPKELLSLMDGIQRIEGFRQGEEKELGPVKEIIDVRRDFKKKITAYLVEDLGWLSPAETVKGILSLEIDGVIANRGGRSYVRTRPDRRLENNLEGKGKGKGKE